MVDYNLLKLTKDKVFECERLTEETQALLLRTSQGNIYSAFIENCFNTENYYKIFDEMKNAGDTEVKEIVCMFAPSALDLPSFDIRRAVLSLNEKNANADIYVLGTTEITTVKLGETIK